MMKKHILSVFSCFLMYTCFAQSNNYTITCPENTFLGAFGCSNINDLPDIPRNLEDAIAAPYNIQIEGELPPNTVVDAEDTGVIFFCETDSRVVQRTVYLYLYEFEPWFAPPEVIASCTYTIETIPDLTPIEFTVPPDIEIACGVEPDPSNTGDVSNYENDCPVIYPSSPISFSDEVIVEGGATTILRSWVATTACGLASEIQVQTITINCAPACNLRPGVITCD